jgi:MFS family permease
MLTLEANSSFQSSIIIAFQIAPFLIFGYFFGLMADLVEKRKILIFADLGRAVMILVLFFFHESLIILYFCVFSIGFFTSMFEPSKKSILPFLVKKEHLIFFNKFFAFIEIFAMILGLAIGAFLLSAIGVEKALLLDAATYIASMVLLLFIRYHDGSEILKDTRPKIKSIKQGLRRHKTELLEGVYYLRKNTDVKYIIFNLVFFHFFVVALYSSVVIDYSIRSFEVGKSVLLSFGFDFSSMLVGSHTTLLLLFITIGAMFAPVIKYFFSKFKESTLSVIVFLFGFIIMILTSIMSFILDARDFYIFYILILGCVGIVAGLQYIRYTYLIQMNTEHKYMGRVMAIMEIVYSLSVFSGVIIGSLFNDTFSYQFGSALAGLFCLFGAISFYFSRGKITW